MNALGCVPIREIVPEKVDYQKDGILFCGSCGTPRQMWIMLDGVKKLVPVLCKCREEERNRQDEEWRRVQLSQRIEGLCRTGITDRRYTQMTFERSDVPLKFARNYVDNWPRMERENVGLMIIGDTGTGKTYAAACIANALLQKAVSVYMANIMSVCDRLTNLYDEGRLSYIASLQKYRLLVLDDFGAERGSDFVQEQIYNVVETRYRSGRPLIITSNLTLEQIRECDTLKYARTYDRLKEMCHPVTMEGDSRRRNIANKRVKRIKAILNT